MSFISFENFLKELETIQIDNLDFVVTDENNKILVSSKIYSLSGQIRNLQELKKLLNIYTFFEKNKKCKLTIAEVSYNFFGNKFLRNINDITINKLQLITEVHDLNISQILYLIANIDRIVFENEGF